MKNIDKIKIPTLPYIWVITAIAVPFGVVIISGLLSDADLKTKLIIGLSVAIIILVGCLIAMTFLYINTENKVSILEENMESIDDKYNCIIATQVKILSNEKNCRENDSNSKTNAEPGD